MSNLTAAPHSNVELTRIGPNIGRNRAGEPETSEIHQIKNQTFENQTFQLSPEVEIKLPVVYTLI